MCDWMTPEILAAKERGEVRAVEASRLGREQLAAPKSEEPPKIKVGTVRPEKWERCSVCHAPAINPVTKKCEMASCETRQPADPGAVF